MLLSIKRHEKDYIVFRDSIYLKKFKKAADTFYINLLENNKLNLNEIIELQSLFNQYFQTFKNLVKIDKELGLIGNNGLLDKMENQKKLIENDFTRLFSRVKQIENKITKQFYFQFFIITCIIIIIGISYGFYIADKLVSPLKKLQIEMQTLTNENFQTQKRITPNDESEIGSLIETYNLLLDKLQESFSTINQKNNLLEERNKQLEKSECDLKKNIDLRDMFLAVLSHDMRSPMNTLTGFVNLLKNFSNQISPEEIKKFAYEMELTLENVKNLLDDLLHWAKLQTDNFTITIEKIDIEKILVSNIKLFEQQTASKNISIRYFILPETELETDKNVLNFVLRNVLQNAIKFSKPGGSIEVRVIFDSNFTTFLVKDNGIGMTEKQLKHLFDLKKHTSEGTHHEKGFGLGMMLSKDFMKKVNGDIYAESTPDVGTTFYIVFPKHAK
jgi:signal transduction histidine kinase